MKHDYRPALATIALLALGGALLVLLFGARPANAQSSLDGWWEVTAYCHTGNRTASGTWPRVGTIAAPRYVSFGTQLHIQGYGYSRVEDRGGAIVGRRLDVYMPSCWHAIQWGRRTVWVSVAAPLPSATPPSVAEVELSEGGVTIPPPASDEPSTAPAEETE